MKTNSVSSWFWFAFVIFKTICHIVFNWGKKKEIFLRSYGSLERVCARIGRIFRPTEHQLYMRMDWDYSLYRNIYNEQSVCQTINRVPWIYFSIFLLFCFHLPYRFPNEIAYVHSDLFSHSRIFVNFDDINANGHRRKKTILIVLVNNILLNVWMLVIVEYRASCIIK